MIPIRVRQFLPFVGELFRRRLTLLRRSPKDQTFHLCFFSCRSHFSYLYCALHSLKQQVHSVNYKIWIFSDEEQPLSSAQIAGLNDLIPKSTVLPWPKSIGWGPKQIESIWRAYAHAATNSNANDIVAKIDSDVFFFNERIFKMVAKSDADMVGDGHYLNFEYSQGGCYFFKVNAVRRIVNLIDTVGVAQLCKDLNVSAEDHAAYKFARHLNLGVWLTFYMMFPDELKIGGGLNSWYRWKFSCLHFVMKNKSAMLEAYERDVYQGKAPSDYRLALTIQ